MNRLISVFVVLLILTLTGTALSEKKKVEVIDFNQDIRPLLSENCFSCHGPDDKHRKAKLRLDTREGAMKERKGRRALVPGDLEKSNLYQRIITDDADDIMPPLDSHLTLKKEDKELDNTVLQEALRIFPTGAKTNLDIEEKVSSIYAQAHLQLLLKRLRVEADDAQKEQWLSQMLALQKEAEKKEEDDKEQEEIVKKKEDPFVWNDFDWNHDGVLQAEEIEAMVQVLRDEPDAMSDKEEEEGAHPPIRERILFLADLKESYSSSQT